MSLDAFRPMSPGILIALTTVGSAGVSASSAGSMQGISLTNLSTVNVYATFFPTSTGVATLPTTSAAGTGPGFWIKGNAERVLCCPPNTFISALTTGAGLAALVGISQGFGIA